MEIQMSCVLGVLKRKSLNKSHLGKSKGQTSISPLFMPKKNYRSDGI